MEAEVVRVNEGSIAEEAGIETGDIIVSINGEKPKDIIEYKFACADDFLELEIEKKDGEIWVVEIEKDYDEDLGLEFSTDTFDKTIVCRNNCMFCFVDQMPPNLRSTLYVKDDDYRLSFLHGNFITMTNLGKIELKRITKYHLSPLYISVHTTVPEVRARLLNNPKAGEILTQLRFLKKHNIDFHAQIVICPGINDGDVLQQTLTDLAEFLPNMLSLAVVPVGLTKFHTGVMRLVNKGEAHAVLALVENFADECYKKTGHYIIAAADELYLIAGESFPASKYYENYPQFENGVGMSRSFIEDFKKASRRLINFPGRKNIRKYVLSGVSGSKVLEPILEEFYQRSGILTDIITVPNNFFGETVTVTGLVTGIDIINTLIPWRKRHGKEAPEMFLPDCMLKKGEELFLDGLTVAEVAQQTNTELRVLETNGNELVKALME